jgi:type III restriction enzyme
MSRSGAADFGIAASSAAKLRRLFAATAGLQRVWIYGSRASPRAREESDIDLALEAPGWAFADLAECSARIEALGLLYQTDTVLCGHGIDAKFKANIERDRRLFWEPVPQAAPSHAVSTVELKDFQRRVLQSLQLWIDELNRQRATQEAASQALRAMEGMEDTLRSLADFPAKAWESLRKAGALPAPLKGQSPTYQSRWDGADRAIPNVCLKVPTGGGKTLLAAAAVGQVMQSYLRRHTGMVLWVVPNEAIYAQTLKALKNPDHPYRQLLAVAGAGRVKVLEKTSPLSELDVQSHLCVMVLMLAAANRRNKETLKFFADSGRVAGFVPREDDIEAHWQLLRDVPNLDAYRSLGLSAEEARATKGSIVKSSLGNAMRLLRPLVVIDEGHHTYTESALATVAGFNPAFMLELSATPRVASAKGPGSNILVNVRGADLDEAEMIKLPIQVDARGWADWQSCLAAALAQLDELQRDASALHGETARYIRPILLVQVERTGADTRDGEHIHAEDAKAHLLRLGLHERQIAIKTSERNDLAAPENIDLLSPACEVRVIITKQALQEGWDCPFAYVLCALAAGRNLAAMTQLIGRILRLPHAAKTGRGALDACHVLCHDARTGEVVQAIKAALEGEGLGDLGVSVRGEGASDAAPAERRVALHRRAPWQGVRLFVPTVSWVEAAGTRRPLQYESDVLARVRWEDFDATALVDDWAPDARPALGGRVAVGLELLSGAAPTAVGAEGPADEARQLDVARMLRALSDIAPQPWWAWQWLAVVRERLRGQGHDDAAVARSALSLTERLRSTVQAERDRLAEAVFRELLAQGRIEFRLRADAADYELPEHAELAVAGTPSAWLRESDGQPVGKSLLSPALRTPDVNDFEWKVAGYLDEQQAVRWWHRNVARQQTGLQGWKRDKVYPDFVFAMDAAEGAERVVLLETKGLHLANDDTRYKQALLQALTAAYRDERYTRVGSLALEGGSEQQVVCDLVFDVDWRGSLASRHFAMEPNEG